MPSVTETSTKAELLAALNDIQSGFTKLLLLLNEEQMNQQPFEHSWTAAELTRHVCKSTAEMAIAMEQKTTAAARNPGEKIAFLKEIFLNYSKKMQSPDFIMPEKNIYTKENSILGLQESFQRLIERAGRADLHDRVDGMPFGEVTKLEVLHFVIYHSERHFHQLGKIFDALKMKE